MTAAADLVTQGKKQMRAMNYDKAKATFTQAVDQGSLEAVYQLGMLYSNSNYDGYNKETALSYFLKAANNSHVEAMYQAGMMYLGTDNSAAKIWLRKAASNGHSRAQAQLSRLR
jgi:TPR repeat protein